MKPDKYIEHLEKTFGAKQCQEGPMPPVGVSYRTTTMYTKEDVPVKRGATTVIETHATEHTSVAVYVKAQPMFLLNHDDEADVEKHDEQIRFALKPLPGEAIDSECDNEYSAIAFMFIKNNRERVQLARIDVKNGKVQRAEPLLNHEPERLAFALARLSEYYLPIISVLFNDGKWRREGEENA